MCYPLLTGLSLLVGELAGGQAQKDSRMAWLRLEAALAPLGLTTRSSRATYSRCPGP